MIPISMTLRYAHPLGSRAPYFDGLRKGLAIASCCASCARVSFPPQPCCESRFQWQQLAGTGTVIAATDGYALIAMDGAANLALGILHGDAAVGSRVMLTRSPVPAEHPAASAVFQVLTGSCIASE